MHLLLKAGFMKNCIKKIFCTDLIPLYFSEEDVNGEFNIVFSLVKSAQEFMKFTLTNQEMTQYDFDFRFIMKIVVLSNIYVTVISESLYIIDNNFMKHCYFRQANITEKVPKVLYKTPFSKCEKSKKKCLAGFFAALSAP